jgi:hypothetical protein
MDGGHDVESQEGNLSRIPEQPQNPMHYFAPFVSVLQMHITNNPSVALTETCRVPS